MLFGDRAWSMLIIGVLATAATLVLSELAAAQSRYAATVTAVVDGDTLNAQVRGGPALEVQLIGIDAPERAECGGREATDYLRQLALGMTVALGATQR